MSPGKVAAQAGHAFKLATYQILKTHPEQFERYLDNSIGTNVCLVAKNLEQIFKIRNECEELGLNCALIEDEGHIHTPHFDGSSIITALGVGPIFNIRPPTPKKLSVYR